MDKPVVLLFAGWAQNPISLQPVFSRLSSSHQIINFDYSRFSSVEDCFTALKNLSIQPQIIAGWSLGGQIASRLIANKIFAPELLVLFSTPFQFVKTPQIAAAMPVSSFNSFRDNFAKNSIATLEKFSLLMMIDNPKRAKELADNLYINPDNHANLLFWLDELERFSCYDLDFSGFGRTMIFHGEGDMVVNVSQAKIFHEKIAGSKLKILANCGHCPHISNLDEVQEAIYQFYQPN
ncbi:MAG: pimeloyl-[acyl-carrier protein] methyl ester esterase [Rickettsiaceae bacterium]|jgi:pimeloyl-ACP methyl ester carboxylesterase|nr:pimeloyl-[acyl-carrier protein] methyl ester esterase [Rickettsiaceae bacterium]